MYDGDTAMVGLQYSYLPSWLSFLVDKERAREAGRDLFNQVYGVWSRLPPQQRPQLLVFGESLGSFGAESAFSGVDDIRNRVDGMLLVGPPNRNEPVARVSSPTGTRARTEVLPTYEQGDDGPLRRDAAADLDGHRRRGARRGWRTCSTPSDPIVWWAPTADRQPSGLAATSPAAPTCPPAMRWYRSSRSGRSPRTWPSPPGCRPGTATTTARHPVAAWADIAPPDGWTAERTAALTAIIARYGE